LAETAVEDAPGRGSFSMIVRDGTRPAPGAGLPPSVIAKIKAFVKARAIVRIHKRVKAKAQARLKGRGLLDNRYRCLSVSATTR
jgi:hypothetical protein